MMRLTAVLMPLLMFAATPAAAQDRLPPANPLPPPDADTAQVLAPVNALFAGIAARDPTLIAPHLLDGAIIVTTGSMSGGPSEVQQVAAAKWLAGLAPGPERFEETMPYPAVEIDGDVAMVWGFYTFHIDGKLSHCGVDHFSLVRKDGAWKVASLTFSMRTTGCGGAE